MKEIDSPSDLNEHIASELLRIEAIKLKPKEPFTWSSGWKSPRYCDNRMTLSYPDLRETIKLGFSEQIKQRYPNVECIAGVATAGIPQGALVADELGLPFIYVRSKPKGHGMENMIEGKVVEGQKVVVIEDLISTGGSSIKAIHALRACQLDVLGLGAIFTYDFPHAAENLKSESIDYFSLSDYNVLLPIARQLNYIKEEDMVSLSSWRKAPDAWNQ